VGLLIGLDNMQLLLLLVEDSWDPDDDMRLMKSTFRQVHDHGRLGEKLVPKRYLYDKVGNPEGRAGRRVQLEEYNGRSQSGWGRGGPTADAGAAGDGLHRTGNHGIASTMGGLSQRGGSHTWIQEVFRG
jgi:hypothetical protein